MRFIIQKEKKKKNKELFNAIFVKGGLFSFSRVQWQDRDPYRDKKEIFS